MVPFQGIGICGKHLVVCTGLYWGLQHTGSNPIALGLVVIHALGSQKHCLQSRGCEFLRDTRVDKEVPIMYAPTHLIG